jgi:predicted MPP superfamily phosphohydrolase
MEFNRSFFDSPARRASNAVSAAVQLRLCHPRVTGGRAKACPPLGSILLGMVRYTVLLSALLSLPTLPAQVITATLFGTAGPSIARRFLLSGFLLLPVLSWGQQQPIFFVQMSDPQFGMYTDNQDFAQETANFEFAIANINRLRPAFVVVTGDLVNKPADAQQLAEYKRIAGKLDSTIPLYSVPGNHDVGNTPSAASLKAYRQNIGADYYTFHSGGLEGIVLNSSLIQHPEGVPEEAGRQQKWLELELVKARDAAVQCVVVFQHIPFFLHTPDEADQYFNIPATQRSWYLDLLQRSGVRYVFAGHLHNNSFGKTESLEMITTGPVGKPLGTGASGMRVARLDSDGIQQAFFDFAHLPNQLSHIFEKQ